MTTTGNTDDSQNEVVPTIHAVRPWWRLPVFLALVLIAILIVRGRGIRHEAVNPPVPNAGGPPADANAQTVSITVDFGDERESRSKTIPWHAGVTVRELLASASVGEVGETGTGASALLTEIDGVKNAGAGGRNWMYSVNGERGDRSYAVYELQPGDQVLWSFTPPQ